MICSKCGKEYSDDTRFCTECGTELTADNANAVEATVEVEKEVKTEGGEEKSNKKLIGLAAAAVAIFLLILVPLVCNSGDDSYMKYSDESIIDVAEIDGKYCVIYANGDKDELDEEPGSGARISMDGTVAVFTNEDDELVIFADGKEIKTGIDDVSYIRVSTYGDTVAFFTDCETAEFKVQSYYDEWYDEYYYNTIEIEVGTLNVYDVKKKKNTEIADEVRVGSAVLSPDGNTVAYVAEYELNDDDEMEFTGYYSVNGKDPEELGSDKRAFAIADKAKYIYFSDAGRLYVHAKKDDVKLANEVNYSTVLLNKDYSEMMYSSDGKTYITVDGKEKEKVCGSVLSDIMLKDDASTGYYSIETENGYIYVTSTGVDTFKERLFYSDSEDQVHYVLKNYESEKIASVGYMEDCIVSDDGESMVYLDGSKVMKVTKFAKGGEKEKLAKVTDAYNIYANGDLSKIYVLNEKDDLYYVKKDKEIEVAEDVTAVAFSPDGKYLYYVEDEETLFYTKNGKKTKEIFAADDGSLDVENYYGISVFAENYDDDEVVMYSVKGKKAKELYTIE